MPTRYTPVYVQGLLGLARSNRQEVIFYFKSGGSVRSTPLSVANPKAVQINNASAHILYEDIERHEFTEKKLSKEEKVELFEKGGHIKPDPHLDAAEDDGYRQYNLRGGYGSASFHKDSTQQVSRADSDDTGLQQFTIETLQRLDSRPYLSDEEVLYILKQIPPNDRAAVIKKLDPILENQKRNLTGIMMRDSYFNQDVECEPQMSLETHRTKLRARIEANGRK